MSHPTKPTVKCKLVNPFLILGAKAMILPFNHDNHAPNQCVSNKRIAFTSKVVAIGEGCFETENTFYTITEEPHPFEKELLS